VWKTGILLVCNEVCNEVWTWQHVGVGLTSAKTKGAFSPLQNESVARQTPDRQAFERQPRPRHVNQVLPAGRTRQLGSLTSDHRNWSGLTCRCLPVTYTLRLLFMALRIEMQWMSGYGIPQNCFRL